MSLIQRLRERKLVQWALAYLAGAFVVLQVVDLLAEIWGLAEVVGQAAFVVLLVGFFAALILAWYHGEQGRQVVSGPELVIIAILLALGGLGIAATVRRTVGPPESAALGGVVRSVIGTGRGVAVAPDGRRVAFVRNITGVPTLHVRLMDDLEPQRLAGTEGASQPFFSPDREWIGFAAEGLFKRVSVAGGDPIVISPAPIPPLGASWGLDDTIIFAAHGTGLQRVPVTGSDIESTTLIALDDGEAQHAWPSYTPDGDHVLFTSILENEERRLGVLSLGTGTVRWIPGLQGSVVRGWHTHDGYLIYADNGGTVWAARLGSRFDGIAASEPTGDQVRVVSPFGVATADAAMAAAGILVYSKAVDEDHEVVVALEPGSRPQPLARSTARPVMVSPDNDQLAIVIRTGTERYVGVLPTHGGPIRRLTFDRNSTDPVWTPDGTRIAYATTEGGPANIHWVSVEGESEAEPLLTRDGAQYPHAFTADGRYLLFYELTPSAGRDIWMMYAHPDSTPVPLLWTPFNERMPAPSPDGRWFAYVSDETGTDEIYVQAFPSGGRKHRISSSGGRDPVWSSSGEKLFFRVSRGQQVAVMSAAVRPPERGGDRFDPPVLEVVLEGAETVWLEPSGSRSMDVSPSGDRFFYTRTPSGGEPSEIVMVQGLHGLLSSGSG